MLGSVTSWRPKRNQLLQESQNASDWSGGKYEWFCLPQVQGIYGINIVLYPPCILNTSSRKVKLWEEFATDEAKGM